MKRTTLVANGSLVLPDTVVKRGGLYLEDTHIVDVGPQDPSARSAGQVIDAAGGYIMPGFIDLHSDAIEKEIEPRPKAYFPLEIAFRELEKKTAGQGITTMFHSFSFAGAEFGIHAACRLFVEGSIHDPARGRAHGYDKPGPGGWA